MYRQINPPQHMSRDDAATLYPNNYILIRWDSKDISNPMGTVLYVGDDDGELYDLVWTFDDPSNCGLTEGLNLQCSLGGVVIGA